MCRTFLILLIGFILHVTAEEIASTVSTLKKNPSKVGEISEAKCWEYGESVFHVSASPIVEQGIQNLTTCSIEKLVLVPGVEDAKEEEFPHMVLLGYGEKESTRSWLCGGTLISNQFVLTSGHCVISRDFGRVSSIRLGALSNVEKAGASHADFSVIEAIRHPSYRPPSRYNDIALLKMDRPTEFNKHIRPACLHTTFEIPNSKYIKTGWGLINDQCKKSNDTLKKVVLEGFTQDQCYTSYKNHLSSRNLKNGIIPESQMCAGGLESVDYSCDPCQGSGGGPLQIYHPKVHCMYSIVGVVSFGKTCAGPSLGVPDVYTRVSNYIEWIEKIVWSQG